VSRAYLSLGSNIEPQKNLAVAVKELERRFGELDKSCVYRSRAYGFDGDDFLNLVVGLDTELLPIEIYDQIEELQQAAGRNRRARGFSSRTLDIDLLLYGGLVVNEPPIRLPRSDVLRFGFVLGPLAEIAPDLEHPETGQSIRDHWKEFDSGHHPITLENIIF
jgi:2-amino-4-hydroxy-6-hydroxymethyldihydropteridine diphosphokinase